MPGQSIAVLDAEQMLVSDVFPCEDAHAQERSLLPEMLETVAHNDVWIADRNFCTRAALIEIDQRQADFIMRAHQNLPWEAWAPLKAFVQGTFRGMMIALPPPLWHPFESMPIESFSRALKDWATAVDLNRFKSSPRRPKKPKQKKKFDPKHPLLLLVECFIAVTRKTQPTIERFDPVFWLESGCVVAFGVSWFVKGEGLLEDRHKIPAVSEKVVVKSDQR